MYDRFDRKIDYLRISVTDKCNLRCVYCMPEDGVTLIRHQDVLSFEEIVEVVRAAAALGVVKVRLTGGEPLTRRGVVDLVGLIAEVDGIEDFAMTTNGLLLAETAAPLHEAGLHRVNVSLDTVDAARFAEITRGGDVKRVLEGIRSATAAGLEPLKLNCVVERSSNEPDARSVAAYAAEKGLEVRYIRRMDTGKAEFWVVDGGSGGDCGRCNRLRLSSDGMMVPCLFGGLAFSVRELGATEAVKQAVMAKPESGKTGRHSGLFAIGG